MGKMKGISVHTKPCCVHHTHMALTPSPSYSSLETKQDIIHSEDFSGGNLIYKEHVHYGGGDLCTQKLHYRVSNERTERWGVSDPPLLWSVVRQNTLTYPTSLERNQCNLKQPAPPLKISRAASRSLKQLQGKHMV